MITIHKDEDGIVDEVTADGASVRLKCFAGNVWFLSLTTADETRHIKIIQPWKKNYPEQISVEPVDAPWPD
jgi:hypothetical protein